jgi:Kef-type K+ transport system membrane component KefB
MTASLHARELLAVAAIVLAAQLGGAAFRALGQPRVVGEIVAGIVLGPTVLGAVVPGATDALVPPDVRPTLAAIAQLGLVVFMLVVGMEVDGALLRRRARFVGVVAASSMLLPFALGAGLGAVLHAHDAVRVHGAAVPWAPFVAFCGLAFSVTAFPVLARLLRDRGMAGTPLGSVALACAALTDLAVWLVLAVVVAAVSPGGLPTGLVLLALAGLVAVVLGALRPALAAAQRRGLLGRLAPVTGLGLLLAGAFGAAWITESLGLHAIFGPFLLGLAVPRHAPTVEFVRTRAAELSATLLLPAFFVVAGLGVDLTALDGAGAGLLALALAIAVVGKVAGAAVPARALGASRADALSLGVLMNTRGLTELVLLSVGLEAGLLDARLYTVLVLTAVLTTVATGPLLGAVDRAHPQMSAARRLPDHVPQST